MIGDENVAGFALVSNQVVETLGVRTLLNHEGEVDAESLEALGGRHRISVPARRLAKFRGHADGTFVDGVGEGQSRHATSVFV